MGGFGGADGLARYLREEKIAHLINATHPFADQISANAVRAAATAQVPLLRLLRPGWRAQAEDRWTVAQDIAEAAELCRREGIATNLYYSWSKEFLEAGKSRLLGDTQRQATSREVGELRTEVDQLKHLVAELSLKNRVLQKNLRGQE